jgi:hypothetical protein
MGFRFRKSIKVAPGVKLNIGKKSVGVSMGGKYGGISVNSKTGARARVSAPGTGLSYTSKIGSSSPKKSSAKNTVPKNTQQKSSSASPATDKRAQYEEIVKKENLTKKKAKSIQRTCTIIALSLILVGLLTISSGILGIIFIILGVLFACTAHTYKNIIKTCFDNTATPKTSTNKALSQQTKTSKPLPQRTVTAKQPSAKEETHRITGTSFRQDAIKSLGVPNPDYKLTKEQLIKKNLLNVSIYEYTFKSYKAELVPEPTNEYDSNAIKVVIAGKHVGYIKKGSCAHVKKLMSTNSIKSITATMKGGSSKYISCYDPLKERDKDSYEYESDKGTIGVEVKIQTIG